MGVTKHISQGDGGEQGDPLMPMLFTLEQHGSLVAVQGRLRDNEHVLAYHDDVRTLMRWCGQDWTTPVEPWSGPSTGLLHLHLTQLSRRLESLGWTLSLPVFSCAGVCICPFSFPRAPVDMFGHHRAACAVAGVLGRRGYPLECAAALNAVDGRMLTGFPCGMEPSWPSTLPSAQRRKRQEEGCRQ